MRRGSIFGGGVRAPALVLGLGLVVLVAALDIVVGRTTILIPLLVVGPLVAGIRGRVPDVAVIATLAVVLALVLGITDGVFGDTDHVVATIAVAAGGAIALIATRGRTALAGTARARKEELAKERRARERADLLARAGEFLSSSLDPQEMLARITELAVPELGDLAVLDVLDGDDTLRGSVLSATDEAVAEHVRELRRRFPIDRAGSHPVAVALRTGEPQLTAMLSDETLRRITSSDEHYRLLREGGFRSTMALPLQARGRTAGVLTYVRDTSITPYDEDDLELGRDLAARAALALDNAMLFSELRAAEGRMEAILDNLGEAVGALSPDGSFVFANDAVATLAGVAGADQLLASSVHEVVQRLVFLDESGQPISTHDLPPFRALAGEEAPEPIVARVVNRQTGDDRWVIMRAAPVRDASGALELVVTVNEDVTLVKRQEARQRLLANASKLLTSSLDVGATVDKAAWAAVPELADWARIDLLDDRGRLCEAAVAHRDLEHQAILSEWRRRYPPDPADERGPHEVLRSGAAVVWAKVGAEDVVRYAQDDAHADMMRIVDTRSVIIVPLTAGERVLGTLQLATTGHSGRMLTHNEVELAEELARRAAIAVENARLHAARTHIATTLQRSLLPPRLPVIPGLTIAARFRAAGPTSEVGGDFYDLFAARNGWMVIMGDVTGKGPAAAAITSLARYTMRTAAGYEDDPRAVLERLNGALGGEGDHRRLCTAVCVAVQPTAHGTRLEIACAGHPAPLLIRASSGEVRPVGPPGTLLGAFPEGHWHAESVDLEPGDAVVLYTDGVTDIRGPHGRFGSDRLESVLRDLDTCEPDEIAGRIDRALQDFGEQRDDVALLVLGADPCTAGEATIVGTHAAGEDPT